ncbi:MAG TPA: alpha-(1-_3)-arabinofuranosyltransferase family protein [Solirubrobacteraceae bacterium]
MNAGGRLLTSSNRTRSLAPAGAIVALSYVLAFVQRPGQVFLDTRVELTLDPVRFLHSVASLWSSTGDLGHFQGGQFVGYLVPMAPWYAFAHAIGLSTWIAERIWMGSLLAAAGLGVMVLLRQLRPGVSWIAQTVAAVLFIANPYVVIVIGRTSVWLLMYAALPWLLVATHRGIRNPRGWRWPAVVGLLVCVANGGANAALIFWILLVPPAFLVYEVVVVRAASWRDAGAFALRAVVCTLAVSLWWVIPVVLQSQYGTNPLPFTEQPTGILTTPSVSESLRLLGFWFAYFGGPAGPSVGSVRTYLFDPAVILATFLVPLAAIAGFGRSRRWSYAPFMLLLLATGVTAMSLGFPPGSPLNRIFVSVYYQSGLVQALRTTWKAAPLVALPIACLAGLWGEQVVHRARSSTGLRLWRRRIPAWALAPLAAVPILWGLPLFTGSTVDRQNAYGSVPHYWRAAVRGATSATTSNQRIMILPGALFAWYRWGDTDDSVAPFLTPRRVTVRELARFADPHSSQLQTAIDDLVQQDRLVPGQLEPLLQLLGVGAVLVPTDYNVAASGSVDPADAADALREQRPFQHPAQSYGRSRSFTPMPGRDGPPVSLPDVRRYSLPKTSAGVVRVHPLADTTILDGDASGIVQLAADHMLNPSRALVYSGDLTSRTIGQLVASGARLVFSDSNRRQILASASVSENVGPTLEARDPINPETPHYDLFPARGASGQTVTVYSGLDSLRTPGLHAADAISPEDAPYAALDGHLDTAWVADPASPPSERYIDLKMSRPLLVGAIRIHPLDERLGVTLRVAISVNSGPEQNFRLTSGWNTLPVGAVGLRELRVRIIGSLGLGTAGGISELQIPGLKVSRALRLPTDLTARTRGLDLRHNEISILLARTTADFPYREQTAPASLQAGSMVHAADAESDIRRVVTLPEARRFTFSGWASVRGAAPGPLLDQLAHVPRGWQFSSSQRFEGRPINRASSAFDNDPSTAWVSHFVPRQALPWIQWSSPRRLTIRRLQLVPGASRYEFPTQVRVTAPGGNPHVAAVAQDGTVALSHPIRARTVRLTVLDVRAPIGKTHFTRYLDGVAIAEIRVPGLAPASLSRRGGFETACGALSVIADGAAQPAQVYGTFAALDRGDPLPLRSCVGSRGLKLHAGTNLVYAPAGRVMQADHIVLNSPAPDPLAAAAAPRLTSAGSSAQGSQTGVRLAGGAPGWLVLGESYSPGWQAWCSDRAGHERALGSALPIDGFANGWRVGPTCISARMAFTPQSTVNAIYGLSAVAIVVLIALALGMKLPQRARVRVRRRARLEPAPAARPIPNYTQSTADLGVIRLGLRGALALGIGVGALTGFVFAIRFGVVAGPLTAVLLLTGVSVRRLTGISMAGVLVIAGLYVFRPAHNYGGFSFYFSLHQILAHWIGAGVLCALVAAAVLQAGALRGRRRARTRRHRVRRRAREGAKQPTPTRIGSRV